ncbi:MAG TPA: fumarylacetoacetate hydrolase family protein, partial [Candidatus Thalassarchaeaceae archaeon]|nr:fumarylacetoacetate hydrolase family protein [Candidatus Thalassarchaeaceae archaeon]
QDDSTSLMIHSVADLIGHLKGWYDLTPGDLIWTGTPKGVGKMHVDDRVEASLVDSAGNVISKLSAICVVNN